MRVILIFLIALLSWLDAMATAQMSDRIIYKGKEYMLHSNPMEEYFEKHPEKQPRGGIVSTALWRGYVATFEVRDNIVYLKDIEVMYRDTSSKGLDYIWRSVLKDVVPDGKELTVDWITGLLVLPHGEIVNYVHMGYASTYENYTLLEVDKGIVKREMSFDYKAYDKFRDRQYKAFKKTEEYKKIKADLMKDENSEEFIDSFLREYIIKYTSRILTD